MHTFTDAQGRAWTVSVNVAQIKRVRGMLGVDLLKLVEDRFSGLAGLLADPVTLCDVLYVLCKEEADARGVNDEAFGRGLAGDGLERAADAFVEEYIDFFPDRGRRETLRALLAKARTAGQRAVAAMAARVAAIDPDRLLETSTPGSGEPPAPSA